MPGVQGAGGHRRAPPQRRVLPRPLPPPLRRAGEARHRLAQDARTGRAGAGGGVGRQGLARAVGHPRPARLRGRRPLPRARDRRVLRRVGHATHASSSRADRPAAHRGRPRRRLRLRHPRRRRGHASSPVRCVRAVEAPPLQLGRARARLRRRRHRPQPRRRSRGAARQRAALGDRLPRPSASGAARGARLRPQGEAAGAPGRARDRRVLRAAAASTTRSRSARWPRATGTSGTRRCSTRLEDRSPGTKAAFLFGFLERGHERFTADAGVERDELRGVHRVRCADTRRRLRVLPAPCRSATVVPAKLGR